MFRAIVIITVICVGGSLAKVDRRYLQTMKHKLDEEIYCGQPLQINLKISSGHNATGFHPWNVGIYEKGSTEFHMICGGSLVSLNLVLTAAHCFENVFVLSTRNRVFNDYNNKFKIAVAKVTRDITIMDNSFTSLINVDSIYVEEDYEGDGLNYHHDIAIVKLSTKVTISNLVLPACIDWNKFYNVTSGDMGKVVGWGKTEKDSFSDYLLEGNLTYIDRHDCRMKYKNSQMTYSISKEKFCANSKMQGVLEGDSGAGLTFEFDNKHYLIGLVSIKEKDSNDTLALFTDVTQNIDWIYRIFTTINETTIDKSTQLKKSPAVQMCYEYSKLIHNFIDDPMNSSRKIKVNDCLDAQTQIVGGSLALSKEFPHMVILIYYDWAEWRCGGSLISNKWVLSSATCSLVTNERHARIARLGGLNYFSKTKDPRIKSYNIVDRKLHPSFKPNSMYDDIALLRLKTEVEFSPYIRPICLNTDQSLINPSTDIIATGWGVSSIGMEQNKDLLKVSINSIPFDKCQKGYTDIKGLENGISEQNMICAGRLEGGKDTCLDDHGGPLQIVNTNYTCMYTQIGVIPFGLARCGSPNSPGVYTKVSNYIPWIEGIVWPEIK